MYNPLPPACNQCIRQSAPGVGQLNVDGLDGMTAGALLAWQGQVIVSRAAFPPPASSHSTSSVSRLLVCKILPWEYLCFIWHEVAGVPAEEVPPSSPPTIYPLHERFVVDAFVGFDGPAPESGDSSTASWDPAPHDPERMAAYSVSREQVK